MHAERLQPKKLVPVPGFDGAFVIAAGGHTPGSQIVTAVIVPPNEGARGYVFTGDIVNNLDGVTYDVPKPFLYSLLIVPEDLERLQELRHYVKDLRGSNFQLLVSHDQNSLEQSGVPVWPPAPSLEGALGEGAGDAPRDAAWDRAGQRHERAIGEPGDADEIGAAQGAERRVDDGIG